MDKTIQYYNSHAEEFFSGTVSADMGEILERFCSLLPAGGLVLDAGCGSGRDTKYFIEHGFRAEAFDASEEIAKKASEYTGIQVSCRTFEEFRETQKYDGIWACASLLHVKKDDIDDVVKRLAESLKPGGHIYVSFKYGTGEKYRGERFFLDMDEKGIEKLLKNAGLDIQSMFVTGDVRDGRSEEKWMNAIAEKG